MRKENVQSLSAVQKKFKALGTNIDIHIVLSDAKDAEKAENDITEARRYYRAAESIFSRFDHRSELSVLNANLGVPSPVSSEMKTVVQHILVYHGKTEEYFDPRIIGVLEQVGYDRDFKDIGTSDVSLKQKEEMANKKLAEELVLDAHAVTFGSRMDFSGIVKGWVTDEVVRFLRRRKWKNFLVDSGGDMYCEGMDKTGSPWYVDIEGISHERIMFELDGCGVATSGITRRKWERGGSRFHHLVNPKNPFHFSFDLSSVTVIAARTEEADVLAKAVFLMGARQGKQYAEKNALACVMLDRKGSAWMSPAIRKFLFKGNDKTIL